jgi:hypothetical protein
VESQNNTRYDKYYGPEIQMVADQYIALENDAPALERFVKERQTAVSEMMTVR